MSSQGKLVPDFCAVKNESFIVYCEPDLPWNSTIYQSAGLRNLNALECVAECIPLVYVHKG